MPLIEFHRVCYFETSNKVDQLDLSGWKKRFAPWEATLGAAGVGAEVFVWDDFHDRYVISDLIGINIPNGLDTTTDPAAITTWTRLGRDDRDDVQREFESAAKRHKLWHRFRIP